jgi:hypothetical protein
LDDAYLCDNIQWEFASDDIFEKVLDKYNKSRIAFIQEFLTSSEGFSEMVGLRGHFLEFDAPEKIATGGKIEIRVLTKNNNKKCGPILNQKFHPLVVEKVSYSSSVIINHTLKR